MKINRITKTKIAVFTGITGGLIFLLFIFYGIGIKASSFSIIAGLFGTIVFTSLVFLLINTDHK